MNGNVRVHALNCTVKAEAAMQIHCTTRRHVHFQDRIDTVCAQYNKPGTIGALVAEYLYFATDSQKASLRAIVRKMEG